MLVNLNVNTLEKCMQVTEIKIKLTQDHSNSHFSHKKSNEKKGYKNVLQVRTE